MRPEARSQKARRGTVDGRALASMKNPSKVFYALIAAGTLAALGFGTASAGGQGFLFALFATLVLAGSLMCVFEPSVVRSAFCLLGTFGGTAGLFVLLGADFLAMSQLLIYVGGILALLLFGVMLTPPDLGERRLPRVVGGSLAAVMVTALFVAKVSGVARWVEAAPLPPPTSRTEELGVGFLAAQEYMIAFELAAVVLTVALVAAVYIARRKKEDLVENPPPARPANEPHPTDMDSAGHGHAHPH